MDSNRQRQVTLNPLESRRGRGHGYGHHVETYSEGANGGSSGALGYMRDSHQSMGLTNDTNRLRGGGYGYGSPLRWGGRRRRTLAWLRG